MYIEQDENLVHFCRKGTEDVSGTEKIFLNIFPESQLWKCNCKRLYRLNIWTNKYLFWKRNSAHFLIRNISAFGFLNDFILFSVIYWGRYNKFGWTIHILCFTRQFSVPSRNRRYMFYNLKSLIQISEMSKTAEIGMVIDFWCLTIIRTFETKFVIVFQVNYCKGIYLKNTVMKIIITLSTNSC